MCRCRQRTQIYTGADCSLFQVLSQLEIASMSVRASSGLPRHDLQICKII